MKIKVWVSSLKPERGGYEYPGGVRTAVHLSERDALLDLCEFVHEDDEDGEDGGVPDFATADKDDLTDYLERRQDADAMQSWGVDSFDVDSPGVPEILVKALQEASRALTQLDSLANKHDAVLIDDALTYCREAGQASTPPEQIAAILKANCPQQGDELQADGILRAAMTQFVRESDAEVKAQ